MKVSAIIFQAFFFLIIWIAPFLSAAKMIAGDISDRITSGLTCEFTINIYQTTTDIDSTISVNVDGGNSTLTLTSITYEGIVCNVNVSKTTWVFTHTFPGNGTYSVFAFGSVRLDSIVNMSNSAAENFTLQATLTIDPFIGSNQSPVILNVPIDDANLGGPLIYNVSGFDVDGDSISYQAIPTLGTGGMPVSGYSFPPASNSFSIDSVTGDINWDSPLSGGFFSIGVLIKEWRSGQMISSTIRDMLIGICQPNSISEFHNENDGIKLFPNPALDVLTIETLLNENKSLVVYNLFGNKMVHEDFSAQKHFLDISNLAKGIYIIEIKSANTSTKRPIVKI